MMVANALHIALFIGIKKATKVFGIDNIINKL